MILCWCEAERQQGVADSGFQLEKQSVEKHLKCELWSVWGWPVLLGWGAAEAGLQAVREQIVGIDFFPLFQTPASGEHGIMLSWSQKDV